MDAAPNSIDIATTLIRTDGGTQPRAAIYQNVIDDYAGAVVEGAKFPPVIVFYDGTDYWLADGFHRLAAYKQAKAEKIPADIRQGTRRDAILHSVGANESHGLRRTNEDKRRAVMTLLTDTEWSNWSGEEIARRCAVSNTMVSNYKMSLSTVESDIRTYTDKHGNISTMNTSAIGKPSVMPYDPNQADEIIRQAKSLAEADINARHEMLHGDSGLLKVSDLHVRGTTGTGENEWYTPEDYLDLARTVLGTIDLDPASNEIAQRKVRAAQFYTKDDDGLSQDWRGNVWLNPPYALASAG